MTLNCALLPYHGGWGLALLWYRLPSKFDWYPALGCVCKSKHHRIVLCFQPPCGTSLSSCLDTTVGDGVMATPLYLADTGEYYRNSRLEAIIPPAVLVTTFFQFLSVSQACLLRWVLITYHLRYSPYMSLKYVFFTRSTDIYQCRWWKCELTIAPPPHYTIIILSYSYLLVMEVAVLELAGFVILLDPFRY